MAPFVSNHTSILALNRASLMAWWNIIFACLTSNCWRPLICLNVSCTIGWILSRNCSIPSSLWYTIQHICLFPTFMIYPLDSKHVNNFHFPRRLRHFYVISCYHLSQRIIVIKAGWLIGPLGSLLPSNRRDILSKMNWICAENYHFK